MAEEFEDDKDSSFVGLPNGAVLPPSMRVILRTRSLALELLIIMADAISRLLYNKIKKHVYKYV